MYHVSIEICGLYYHTDFDPSRDIQQTELHDFFTLMLDIDDETVLKEQEEYGFSPHQILNEEEWDFKYYNKVGILTDVYLQ